MLFVQSFWYLWSWCFWRGKVFLQFFCLKYRQFFMWVRFSRFESWVILFFCQAREHFNSWGTIKRFVGYLFIDLLGCRSWEEQLKWVWRRLFSHRTEWSSEKTRTVFLPSFCKHWHRVWTYARYTCSEWAFAWRLGDLYCQHTWFPLHVIFSWEWTHIAEYSYTKLTIWQHRLHSKSFTPFSR